MRNPYTGIYSFKTLAGKLIWYSMYQKAWQSDEQTDNPKACSRLSLSINSYDWPSVSLTVNKSSFVHLFTLPFSNLPYAILPYPDLSYRITTAVPCPTPPRVSLIYHIESQLPYLTLQCPTLPLHYPVPMLNGKILFKFW